MVDINTSQILTTLVSQGINALIALLTVVVLLVIGYVVAVVVAGILKTILKKVKLEESIKEHGLENALLGFSITQLASVILKVYIVFLFLGTAADLINLTFFTDIVASVLGYIPSLVQGLIVLSAVLFVGAYVSNTIRKEKKIGLAQQIGLGVQVFVAYIGVLIGLPLLLPGVGDRILVLERLLELFMITIVLAVGLGAGLAFGLGLKDTVARVASKNEDMIESLIGRGEKRGL
ncbi:MAG: hypothetical protein FJY77_04525 [Candidatus Altiarchaeales archaeon]|nr:hypothetical protein [Candidatus Altiarchaeales archaeon]